ncbi:MAG: hypothetical protein Q9218_004359 [Villophora microphyllina]
MGRPSGAKNHPKAPANPNQAGHIPKSDTTLNQLAPVMWSPFGENHTELRDLLLAISEAIQTSRSPEAKYQPRIRYSFTTQADRSKVQKMSSKDIVGAFHGFGNGLEYLRAAHFKNETLHFFLHSEEDEEKVRRKASTIHELLDISEGCKSLWEQYMAVALHFDYDKKSMPNPDKHKKDWSEENRAPEMSKLRTGPCGVVSGLYQHFCSENAQSLYFLARKGTQMGISPPVIEEGNGISTRAALTTNRIVAVCSYRDSRVIEAALFERPYNPVVHIVLDSLDVDAEVRRKYTTREIISMTSDSLNRVLEVGDDGIK